MAYVDDALVHASRRLGSLARRAGGDQSWVYASAAAQASRLHDIVSQASHSSLPADLDHGNRMLCDPLDRGFFRLLLVLATGKDYSQSQIWARNAANLLQEAANDFACRGRFALAVEVCRAGAVYASACGLDDVNDRMNIRAEDYLTRVASFRHKVFRLLLKATSQYGYAPLRIFVLALVVMLIATLVVHATLGLAWPHALALATGDYVTLGGAPEFTNLSAVSRILLSAEALIAIVINGFFITLLARRWFSA